MLLLIISIWLEMTVSSNTGDDVVLIVYGRHASAMMVPVCNLDIMCAFFVENFSNKLAFFLCNKLKVLAKIVFFAKIGPFLWDTSKLRSKLSSYKKLGPSFVEKSTQPHIINCNHSTRLSPHPAHNLELLLQSKILIMSSKHLVEVKP